MWPRNCFWSVTRGICSHSYPSLGVKLSLSLTFYIHLGDRYFLASCSNDLSFSGRGALRELSPGSAGWLPVLFSLAGINWVSFFMTVSYGVPRALGLQNSTAVHAHIHRLWKDWKCRHLSQTLLCGSSKKSPSLFFDLIWIKFWEQQISPQRTRFLLIFKYRAQKVHVLPKQAEFSWRLLKMLCHWFC